MYNKKLLLETQLSPKYFILSQKKKKSKKQSVHFNYTYGTYACAVAIKYRLSHSSVLWGLLISIFVLDS